MNPGAQQFQPGAGRGTKRGAEEEGEGGASRGGKRARGGRGGAGAGPNAATDAGAGPE